GERPVQGVDGRAVADRPDADPDRPGVVVQDVELLAVLVHQTTWLASYHGSPMASRGGSSSRGETSRARVSEPGGANRVTSWPRSVSPSASNATTHSMPP